MNWQNLNDSAQLDDLLQESRNKPFVIFKHSTRCSTSHMAKDRLERQVDEGIGINFYYLDLLNYRSISNAVAEKLNIEHESPQLLYISDGKCLYAASHGSINFEDLSRFIKDSQN